MVTICTNSRGQQCSNELSTCLSAGFPRTVAQAEELDKRQDIDMVINLDVPFATIVERIKVSQTGPF